jgi:hypothetical protein
VDLENKEDSRKNVHGASTEKIIQPKIIINQKNAVVDIKESIYRSTKPERNFNLADFGKDELD